MSRQRHFGKFHHIGEFLDYYKKWENNQQIDEMQQTHAGNLAAQVDAMKKSKPDVVEIQAKISQYFGDHNEHYQFYIHVTQLVTSSNDAKVNTDIHNCITKSEDVFLAVRYGDKEGLSQPIHESLHNGVMLHLQGQWITADKAYAQHGEKTSVIHFTHHPIGFICVLNNCYK